MNDGAGTSAAAPVRPAMRVYKSEGGKPKKPRRRWLRVLGWFVLVFVLAGAGLVGIIYYKVHGTVLDITRTTAGDVKAVDETATPTPTLGDKQPITFVIFGVDQRPGETVFRSDTTVLVRLDPIKNVITQLALPRDWMVPVDGYGPHKITEAYALGGPALSLKTIEEQTGITPNYYIQINFAGFTKAVNAFGGTYVEVDRRYFNKNVGGASNYMSIDLQPGYQRLNGNEALSYVRFRHSDLDTIRNARQQEFLAAFKHGADPVSVGTRLFDLLRIAKDNIKIIGKKRATETDLLRWAEDSRAIPKNNVINVHCQSRLVAPNIAIDPGPLQQCIAEFLNPDPSLAGRAASQTTGQGKAPSTRGTVNPATVPVEVRNGNNVAGAAGAAAGDLVKDGWKLAASNGDADNYDYFHTVVLYGTNPGSKDAAAALGQLFDPADVRAITPQDIARLSSGSHAVERDVVVIVGKTFDKLAPPKEAPLPPTQAAVIVSDTTRDLARWKAAQKKARLALMYPIRLPKGSYTSDPQFPSSVDAFRIYQVGGKPAVHVTYSYPGDYGNRVFTYQALGWSAPPILEEPTATRTSRGISYQLYFNGPRLHRVAWRVKGVWYWLSNSLLDSLSNSTMWSVALSFRPVPG